MKNQTALVLSLLSDDKDTKHIEEVEEHFVWMWLSEDDCKVMQLKTNRNSQVSFVSERF